MSNWSESPSHPHPPLTKAFDRKFRRIMRNPDVHETLIPMNIVSPVGNRGPHRPTREVIRVHLSRFAFRTPRLSTILKLTHPFLFLGVDRQGRVSLADEISDPCIDRTKLFIPVGGRLSLENATNLIKDGMSGSPIFNGHGAAIGVVCLGEATRPLAPIPGLSTISRDGSWVDSAEAKLLIFLELVGVKEFLNRRSGPMIFRLRTAVRLTTSMET